MIRRVHNEDYRKLGYHGNRSECVQLTNIYSERDPDDEPRREPRFFRVTEQGK